MARPQPVHATLLRTDRTERGREPGYDVECVLARPDCAATIDVMVDPHGFADPVPQDEATPDIVLAQSIVPGLALLSCVPAARPKRRNPG